MHKAQRRKQGTPRQQIMGSNEELQQTLLASTSHAAMQVPARPKGGFSSLKRLLTDCTNSVIGLTKRMSGIAQQGTSFTGGYAFEGQGQVDQGLMQQVRQLETQLTYYQARLQNLTAAYQSLQQDRQQEAYSYMGQLRSLQEELRVLEAESRQKSMVINNLSEQLEMETQAHTAVQAQLHQKEVEVNELLEEVGVRSQALSRTERELRKLQASVEALSSGTTNGTGSTGAQGSGSSEAGFGCEEQRQVLGMLELHVDTLAQRIRNLMQDRKAWLVTVAKFLGFRASAMPEPNTLNYLLHDKLLRAVLNSGHPTIAQLTPSPAPCVKFTSLPQASGVAAAGDRQWAQAQSRAWFLVTLAMARGALQPSTGEGCAEVNRSVQAAVDSMVGEEFLHLKPQQVNDVRNLLWYAALSGHAALLLPHCLHIQYPRAELLVPKSGAHVVEGAMDVAAEVPGPTRCVAYVRQPGLHQPPSASQQQGSGHGDGVVLVKPKVVAATPATRPTQAPAPQPPSTPQKLAAPSVTPAPQHPHVPQQPPSPASAANPTAQPPTKPAQQSAWDKPLYGPKQQQASSDGGNKGPALHTEKAHEEEEEQDITSC